MFVSPDLELPSPILPRRSLFVRNFFQTLLMPAEATIEILKLLSVITCEQVALQSQ